MAGDHLPAIEMGVHLDDRIGVLTLVIGLKYSLPVFVPRYHASTLWKAIGMFGCPQARIRAGVRRLAIPAIPIRARPAQRPAA
jgi:hypothetical protein